MQPTKTHKNIAAAVKDMMDSGSQVYDPKNPNAPKINAHNLYDLFKHKLTQEARKALEVKTTSLIHQRNEEVPDLNPFLKFLEKTGNAGVTDRVKSQYSGGYRRIVDKVIFLGKITTIGRLNIAVDRVCNGLNRLAEKGYITASLAPLIGITLMRTSKRQKPKIIVTSHFAITAEGEKYVNEKMKKDVFQEGGIPSKI